MLVNFLLQVLPSEWTTPASLIVAVLVLLVFAYTLRKWDVGVMLRPWWYYSLHYTIPNFIRTKIQGKPPIEIHRPELFAGGRGDYAFNKETGTFEKLEGVEDDWRNATHFTDYNTTVSSRDKDLFCHQNNQKYFRHADFARFEFLFDSGLGEKTLAYKLPFVIGAQTIRFRRELKENTNYTIRTRVVCWDQKCVVMEHLFIVKNEVHAIHTAKLQLAVSKQWKEKEPMTATAPVTYLLRNIMKYDEKMVPDVREAPKDVALWLDFLNENYSRVVIGNSKKETSVDNNTAKKQE